MLRRPFYQSSFVRIGARRWMTPAAAATSRQKRAIDPDQLHGTPESSSTTSSPPLALKSAPPGNNAMLPVALVGLTAVAGLTYYYRNQASKEVTPEKALPSSETKPIAQELIAEESIVGNRVRSIEFPPGMKNTAPSVEVAPSPHPEHGNRVGVRMEKAPSPPSKRPIADTSMTQKAISSLRDTQTEEASQALVKSHHSAWSAMDAAFFADLDELNPAQLKARVVQLAAEIKDRTKWEAVRLKEFLAMKEKETASQYMEIVQKQRLEFEDLLAKRLREREDEHSDRLRKALQEKEDAIQSVINAALEAQKGEHEAEMKVFEEITAAEIKAKLEDEYGTKLTQFTEKVAMEMEQKVATIKSLADKLTRLEAALEASLTRKEGSDKAHRLSAAALALVEKLETSQSAASEFQALKMAAGPEGVIANALATIPGAAAYGIPTVSELQSRYDAVNKKARQAAQVPTGRVGLEGQLAGMLFAKIKYAPDPDDAAPDVDKDSAEFVLARAQKYVRLGELERATEQLDKLEGQTAFTVADWKRDAVKRVAVEKALKVIKMECALLNESLVG